MEVELLKSAIKTYARSKSYYLSCINEINRYDLWGKKVSTITVEDKKYAIDRFRKTVNRFTVLEKYPQLIKKENKSTPETSKINILW